MAPKDFTAATSRVREALEGKGAEPTAEKARAHLRSVHAQLDAIAKGDIETVLSLAAADVTLDIFVPPEFPFVRHARGVDDLQRAVHHNFASVDDQQPEITNVFAEGDTVVLFGRERGRLRASGQPYDMEFVHRFSFRDDRLVSLRIVAAHVR